MGDSCRQVQQDRRIEAVADRVERCRTYAVIRGDADDLHLVDSTLLQPPRQRHSLGREALETGVRRGMFALVEDGGEPRGVQQGVKLDPSRADHAMRRPRVHIVGCRREVGARVDVMVPRCDDVVVRRRARVP